MSIALSIAEVVGATSSEGESLVLVTPICWLGASMKKKPAVSCTLH